MLIEYNIIFEKNGFTIKEQIDTNASEWQGDVVGAIISENSLRSSFQESKTASASAPLSGGSAPGKKPGGGGGVADMTGTAPITIIGPFIICCPSSDPKKEGKD